MTSTVYDTALAASRSGALPEVGRRGFFKRALTASLRHVSAGPSS